MAADPSTVVVGGGFALALVFGFTAAKSNFCTMGALSDIVNMGHWGRMRMWLWAVAVAIAGTAALSVAGWADVGKAVFARPSLPWLSLLVGGLLFGVGMTLAGGCANKNLVRVGGGSLRSLVVLAFLAISAYMTLKGLFGQWRASLLDPVRIELAGWADSRLATLLARTLGLESRTATLAAALAAALALAVFVFKDKRFRGNRVQVVSSTVLGLLVVGAWYVSGRLGFGEHPETLENVFFATNTRTIESFSFVAPLAFGLELLLLWTDKSLHLSFGIASALGVALGSAAHALSSRSFRWEGFASVDDLKTQLVGALMMGFGGVTALGCTVGQGMSGLSTLAIGSFIAVGGIVAGSVATLRWMLWKAEQE